MQQVTVARYIVFFSLALSCFCFVPVKGQGISKKGRELFKQAGQIQVEGKYEDAFYHFEKAAERCRSDKDWQGAADALVKAGGIGIYISKAEGAKKNIKAALQLWKDAGLKDSLGLGECHFYFGQYYYRFTQFADSATIEFQSSLHIRERLKYQLVIAQSLIGLGDVERYQRFDYARAEPHYERALRILQEIHEEGFWLTNVYYSLTTTYRFKGDLGRALSYCLEATRLADAMQNPEFKEKCILVLANIYSDMGQYALAEENFRLALQIGQKLGNTPFDQAAGYENLGTIFQDQHQHALALRNFDFAQKIFQSIGEGENTTAADLLVYQAKSLGATGQPKKAIKSFHEAIAIYRKLGKMDHRGVSIAFLELANFYKEGHVPDSALWYYHQAVMTVIYAKTDPSILKTPTVAEIGYRYYLFEPILNKAELLLEDFKNGKSRELALLKKASDHFQLAEELLQRYRNSYDFEASKKRISNQYHWLYESFLETIYLLYRGNVPGADTLGVQIQEKSKAKELQEILLEATAAHSLGLPDSVLYSQHTIAARQTFFYEKLSDELRKPRVDTAVTNYCRRNLLLLEHESATHENKLRDRYPAFYALKFNQSLPGVDQMISRAGKEETVFLEYFWGEKNVYLHVISGDRVVFNIVGNSDSLAARITGLLDNLRDTTSGIGSQGRFLEFQKKASGLYQLLLAQYVSPSSKKVVIIPDGALYQLPFECLLTVFPNSREVNYRDLPYFLMQTSISYSYSVAAYLNRSGFVKGQPKLLAFAYSGSENRGSSRSDPDHDLPGSETELQSLRQIFPAGEFYFGAQATERNFKQHAGDFNILHLAVHGFGAGDPVEAKLIFRLSGDSREDGRLFLHEIYAMKLNASLAVLSACETGVGKFFKGEGIGSLASAFAYAGCPQVVMSLWKVDDHRTAKLMGKFYQHCSEGLTLNDALRLAKTDYIREANELTAHPSFWSSFVLMGNGHPIFNREIPFQLIWFGIGIVTIILVFLGLRKRRRT